MGREVVSVSDLDVVSMSDGVESGDGDGATVYNVHFTPWQGAMGAWALTLDPSKSFGLNPDLGPNCTSYLLDKGSVPRPYSGVPEIWITQRTQSCRQHPLDMMADAVQTRIYKHPYEQKAYKNS